MERTKAEANARLLGLDALRGLAAVAVVLYHFGVRVTELYPETGAPLRVFEPGQYGVQLFFIISGFVIYMTLRRANLRRFVTSRFIRLYPIYWLCLLLTAGAMALVELPGREVTLAQVLVNITMFQAFVGVSAVDGAYWTLAAELSFYMQVAALYYVGMLKGRRAVPVLYGWLGASAAVMLGDKALAGHSIGDFFHLLTLVPGLVWMPLFIAGIGLFRIWSGDNGVQAWALPVAAVAAMALLDVEVAAMSGVMLLAVVAAIWSRMRLPRWGERTLKFLGNISFPLYLIHQNIGYMLIRSATDAGVPFAASVILALIFVGAVASVLTYRFDLPLRKRLRERFLPKRAATHVAP